MTAPALLLLLAAPNGLDIVEQSTARGTPDYLTQTVTMELEPTDKKPRSRTFTLYRRKTTDGWDTRVEFKAPADVAGTVLLIHDRGKKKEQYLWLPRLKRVRRIAGKARGGSFAGSDFSFEDLEYRSASEGTHTFVEAREDCDVVESKPGNAAKSTYTKTLTCFSRPERIPMEVRFYKASGEHKVLTVDAESVKSFGEWKIPTKMTMKSAEHQTTLVIESIDVESKPADHLFDRHALDR